MKQQRKICIILVLLFLAIDIVGFASDIEFEKNRPENVFVETQFDRYIIKVNTSVFDKNKSITSKTLTELLEKNTSMDINNAEEILSGIKELPNDRLVIILNQEVPSDMFCDALKESIAGITEVQPDYYLSLFGATDTVAENVNQVAKESDSRERTEFWDDNKITIALIDSAVDTKHPDLNGYVTEINAEADTISNTNLEKAHGTHIAGLLCGFQKENRDESIEVLSLPAFNNQRAFTSDVIDRISIAKEMGAQIINCSWGSEMPNPALEEMIISSPVNAKVKMQENAEEILHVFDEKIY